MSTHRGALTRTRGGGLRKTRRQAARGTREYSRRRARGYVPAEDVADDVRQPAERAQQVVHVRAPRAHHRRALFHRPQPQHAVALEVHVALLRPVDVVHVVRVRDEREPLVRRELHLRVGGRTPFTVGACLAPSPCVGRRAYGHVEVLQLDELRLAVVDDVRAPRQQRADQRVLRANKTLTSKPVNPTPIHP